ncbi:MAG TPA: DUF192 domain-containing protein [Candidatus Dormibacteraeota bacterium]
MPARGQSRLRLVHPGSGRVLASRLEVPRTFVGRGLGLMFRSTLEEGSGMWISPCNGIHTFFMRFPIDAVVLDRRQRVVRAYSSLGRWRVVPLVFGARSVVELPAGTVAPLALSRGDQLTVQAEGDIGGAESADRSTGAQSPAP